MEATQIVLSLDRWLHFLSGVAWIGLLYFFNFVNVPAVAEANADKGGPGPSAISKYVMPRALLWFRWAALVTWLSGAVYLLHAPNYSFLGAFSLGIGAANAQWTTMGMGAWLGTIMLFNVWFVIWPNQKKLLGLVAATDEEKGRARRNAFLASRANTAMSIPMLLFMGAASHGLPF
ncbi:MAG: urate hydroxylase PuuD [Gammaproteobacteria bacterium]|nr:urate hydroxylase PuuD [Gammaproteobacteria bacterium]